jgi:DNA-binding response OmpR family regulator
MGIGLGEALKVVAVLAANTALSSILTAVLASSPELRVRQFESLAALRTYMRLAAVDLVVADFDCEEAPAEKLAAALRLDLGIVSRDFQLLALARTINADTRAAAIAAGIDEVIVKPMSPRYLLERVKSRLKLNRPTVVANTGYHGPERRNRLLPVARATVIDFAQRRDNVVPLFGDRGPRV